VTYSGWHLTDNSRNELLKLVRPTRPRVYAHHVTYELGDNPTPPQAGDIRVVGTVDRLGVQALVVTVDGATHAPDGRLYHCTWSLDVDKSPKDSNTVLGMGWVPTLVSLRVDTEPFVHPQLLPG